MEIGHYLSTFLCIDELQNMLDIKLRHDQTIALWHFDGTDVKLLRYWELERLSGIKQHPKALYNKEAFEYLLSYLLSQENISIKDIKGIWGTKGIETDSSYMNFFASTGIAFHSIAHLMTSIFYENSSPFKDTILSLNLDAGPDSQFEADAYDKKYYAGCVINNGSIDIFPVESPARLWAYAYKKFGLREGTLMALASATKAEIEYEASCFDNLTFYDIGARQNSRTVIDTLSEYVFSLKSTEIKGFDNQFSENDNKISAIMKIVNRISERIITRNIEGLINKYNLTPEKTILALAGGFALNCPTNSFLLEKYKFRDYQIPPCTSDTGIAAGVGIAAFYVALQGKDYKIHFDSAYYGQIVSLDDDTIDKYKEKICAIESVTPSDIAKDIIEKHLIIWVNGPAEIGPRALGNRSLLADPRTLDAKDKLNLIKKRQWWRPVAPIVMDDHGKEYFFKYRFSPNMLLNFVIKDNKKAQIPAVAHFDDTARVQSVSAENNPKLYEVMEAFYKLTGVPVLCNTSLNDAGEPIINTIGEAIEFALHKGIDAVYCNAGTRILLKNDTLKGEQSFSSRNKQFFYCPPHVNEDAVVAQKNPLGLNVKELTYYMDNPNIFGMLDLTNKTDVAFICKKTKEYLDKNPTALQR